MPLRIASAIFLLSAAAFAGPVTLVSTAYGETSLNYDPPACTISGCTADLFGFAYNAAGLTSTLKRDAYP